MSPNRIPSLISFDTSTWDETPDETFHNHCSHPFEAAFFANDLLQGGKIFRSFTDYKSTAERQLVHVVEGFRGIFPAVIAPVAGEGEETELQRRQLREIYCPSGPLSPLDKTAV